MNTAEQFREAIFAAGLSPPDTIQPDGELHRFASNGKLDDDAGWYVFHGDGIPAGAFGDWRTGVEQTWRADIGRKLSHIEASALAELIEQQRRKREADKAQRHAEARKRAAAIWQEATPARADHPYLVAKGVQSHRIRQHGDDLVVSMRDAEAELHSLQFIGMDGSKRFLTGGRVTGCYFSIGKPNGTLCIAEGFATAASVHEASGHAVAVAFNAANLEAVARALRSNFPDARIVLCADDDYRTDGNPGIREATKAARAVGGLLAIPVFGDNRPEGATDFNDLAQHAGADAVKRAIADACPPDIATDRADAPNAAADDPASQIANLAAMPPLEYDRVRETVAKQLGVRVGTLDAAVRKMRPEPRGDAGTGQALQFAQREPWPEPVDGAALLAELADSATRHLVLPEHADTALALWILFTFTIDAAEAAPILAIVSPEKRCGKSTLLDWLTRLVRNPLPAANVSQAAMFRAIEKWQPTLLIDEADTFLRENEELRGLLNSGHTRSMAFVLRAEGDTHEVKQFSTWGAKAIALIGKLPDTLADRSITIEMRRKMPSERVHKLRGEVERHYLDEVSRRCQRFAVDALPTLKQADPKIPDGLNDRAADSWAPLLAIADVAGGEWPADARTAASVLCGATPDGDSLNVELLCDVRAAFTEREQDRLASTDLADVLAADHERPWAEFNRGKAMTVRQLARRLGVFGILSGTVRLADGKTLKGYKLEQFADAFARYIPPFDPSHRHTQALARVVTLEANVTNESCDGSLLASQTSIGAGCDVVTDGNPGLTRIEGIPADGERF